MARRAKGAGAAEAAIAPRERIKRYLVQRFYTRFHMSLILMSAAFAAMLANWSLLHLGVGRMWVRYPIAVTVSYLTFLSGVWLWIRYMEFRKRRAMEDAEPESTDETISGRAVKSKRSSALDWLPGDLGGGGGGGGSGGGGLGNIVRGGGGQFDGGGAAGTWDDVVPVQSLVSNPGGAVSTPSSGSGFSFDFGDLDGDGLVVILLALALAAALLFASGYIVWFAPDILTEALFGAALAGGVARASNREDAGGWVLGVVKKTWWPFAIVFALAMTFAIYAQMHYPAARTFGEAVALAMGS